jgi:hypothetical protein
LLVVVVGRSAPVEGQGEIAGVGCRPVPRDEQSRGGQSGDDDAAQPLGMERYVIPPSPTSSFFCMNTFVTAVVKTISRCRRWEKQECFKPL